MKLSLVSVKILIHAAFLLHGLSLLGQVSYVRKTYDLPGQCYNGSALVLDSTILFTGSSKPSQSYSNWFCFKTDLNGALKDSVFIDYPDGNFSSGNCNDIHRCGSFLVTAGAKFDQVNSIGYGWIGFLNDSLRLLNEFNFRIANSTSSAFLSMAIRGDSIYTVGHGDLSGRFSILSIDGNVLYSNQYSEPNSYYLAITNVDTLPNGGVVLSGFAEYIASSNYKTKGVVIALSRNLSKAFQKQFGNSKGSYVIAEPSIDGNIFVLGGSSADSISDPAIIPYLQFLAKVNGTGQLIWQRLYAKNQSSVAEGVVDLIENVDGSVCLLGLVQNAETNSSFVCLSKVDSNGNLLWRRDYHFDLTANFNPKKINKKNGGGFYISGFEEESIETGHQSPFLWLVDEYGCLESGCNIGDGIEEVTTDLISIWPVPCKTQLSYNIPERWINSYGIAEITDLSGRVIKSEKVSFLTSTNTLDVEMLDRGHYILRIGNKSEHQARPFTK